GFQKAMLGILSAFSFATKLLDVDHDGDVDRDDIKIIFNVGADFIAECQEDAAEWNKRSAGERLDWLCAHMQEHFPNTPKAVFINVNSILHLSATVLSAAGVTFSLRQLKV
ncbi:MAG: hypothetical protein ABFD94_02805, partial [Armatimonadia bacterium]